MLISQHGELLHTFPRTIFAVKNFTVGGYSCMPDKVSVLATHALLLSTPSGCTSPHVVCLVLL